ncbi:trypsin eta-like [Lucilia cuprina]|uniref:trypsin eta-like n=1 Tax=Lucilia cuprina TaxID=7375 RepID=UPI001F06F06D|nr:trypsin eta-like [Lucilia cuprina]
MLQQFLKLSFLTTLLLGCISTSVTSPIESRVIGGETSVITETPYLVSIRYKKNNSTPFEHRCSGTIYSSKVILTTATCLVGLDTSRIHVKAGSSYRTQNDGYLYLVEKYIIHPDYNIWFMDNDLALLILAFDLTLSLPKEIYPIDLISTMPEVNSSATIAGWGVTDSSANGQFSEILQIANVKIVDVLNCKRSYGENRISPAMLCAAGDDSDACLGDAGGALVYEDNAVGLISWGNGCANSDFPGVYTNLLYFKEWIENEVAKL